MWWVVENDSIKIKKVNTTLPSINKDFFPILDYVKNKSMEEWTRKYYGLANMNNETISFIMKTDSKPMFRKIKCQTKTTKDLW